MKRPNDINWLDEALTKAIGSKKTKPDFEKWKQEHPEAVEMLTSRAVRPSFISKRPLNIRNIIMKNPITKLAIAAVVIIACVIGLSLWRGTESGIALADVLARVEQVKVVKFKWTFKFYGEDPNKPWADTHGTQLTSREYGSKIIFEEPDPNGGVRTRREQYHPKPGSEKRRIHDEWSQRQIAYVEDPFSYLREILNTKYESLGRSTIDGIEVTGFRTTDPNYSRGVFRNLKEPQADVKMWVDVKTLLPVRIENLTSDLRGGGRIFFYYVSYDFQWDVSVDAAEFAPPTSNEETAIHGLKLSAELVGKYPDPNTNFPVLRSAFKRSETPVALRLKEELKGLTEDQISKKLWDFLMPIRGPALFYNRLQWDKKDPAYYGGIVTPKDADKVLMRWKVSDNEYRVIYGDLHTETVTKEKLAELEKTLPK